MSYDGHGMVSYSAQGISGDTGCKVTANELLDYGFDPDVGKFDCTSKSMKLLASPTADGDQPFRRDRAARDAFLDGTLKYTGKTRSRTTRSS